MKYCILLFILFLASCQKKDEAFVKAKHIPSKVDSLVTTEDITAYLKLTDTNFNRFRLKPMKNFRFANDDRKDYERTIRNLANTFNIDKSFYKADFDNNGYTDLLVTGDFFHDDDDPEAFGHPYVYAFLNFGVMPPAICYLNNPYFAEVHLPKLETLGNETLLRLYTIPIREHKAPTKGPDTVSVLLSARLGGFTEYNKAPKHHNIEKIQYHAKGCYGKCPTFEITINSDRSAWFIAYGYNFSDKTRLIDDTEGIFTSTLNTKDFNRITDFINYLDFVILDEQYATPEMHVESAEIIITYNGGKTKTISDYGMAGSYGLRAFYKMMEDLRFNQDWKKAEEPEGIRIRRF